MRYPGTVLSVAWSVMLLAATASAGEPPGQKVFLEQKCNQCHTVARAKIALGGVPEGKPADLSQIGGAHTPDWMKAFLLKKEVLNGEKHKRKFLGPDAELQALVDWLSSLKGDK